MLRRQTEPDEAFLAELFKAAADRFSCPKCEHGGLIARPPQEDSDEEWGMGRKCDTCNRQIPAERLEVFPDARLCVQCQSGTDSGKTFDEPQYCSRCGSILELRQARGSGITRFAMTCPSCGKR